MRGRFAGICSSTMFYRVFPAKSDQNISTPGGGIQIQDGTADLSYNMSSGPPELENGIIACDMFFLTMEKRDWNEVGVPLSICLRSHQSRCSNVESLSFSVDHNGFEGLPFDLANISPGLLVSKCEQT